MSMSMVGLPGDAVQRSNSCRDPGRCLRARCPRQRLKMVDRAFLRYRHARTSVAVDLIGLAREGSVKLGAQSVDHLLLLRSGVTT